MSRPLDKPFPLLVDTEGQLVNKKFDLDKNVKLVIGLLLSSDNPKLLFYRGTQRIELSGDELYPEEFESKLLMSGIGVAPDDKYRTLGDGVIPGNGELKIQFRDTPNPSAPFIPYKVNIVLLCEMK